MTRQRSAASDGSKAWTDRKLLGVIRVDQNGERQAADGTPLPVQDQMDQVDFFRLDYPLDGAAEFLRCVECDLERVFAKKQGDPRAEQG